MLRKVTPAAPIVVSVMFTAVLVSGAPLPIVLTPVTLTVPPPVAENPVLGEGTQADVSAGLPCVMVEMLGEADPPTASAAAQ